MSQSVPRLLSNNTSGFPININIFIKFPSSTKSWRDCRLNSEWQCRHTLSVGPSNFKNYSYRLFMLIFPRNIRVEVARSLRTSSYSQFGFGAEWVLSEKSLPSIFSVFILSFLGFFFSVPPYRLLFILFFSVLLKTFILKPHLKTTIWKQFSELSHRIEICFLTTPET